MKIKRRERTKVNLFSGTIHTLGNSLAYATTKNQTISNNIANTDTPEYKAKEAVFKHVMNNVLECSSKATCTHPKDLPFPASIKHQPFKTIDKTNTIYNHNGNNVDIDSEMAALANNQIYYQALVDRLNGKFNSLQTVIRGGN